MNNLILFLCIIVVLFSCEKSDETFIQNSTENNVAGKLRYVYIGESMQRLLNEFKYNEAGNLIQEIDYVALEFRFNNYSYSTDNPDRIERIENLDTDSILYSYTDYHYDTLGKIIEKIHYKRNYNFELEYDGYWQYEYYDNSFLRSVHIYNNNDELSHHILFEEYDEVGNFHKRKIFMRNKPEPSTINTIEYSQALNPYFIYKDQLGYKFNTYNMESSIRGWVNDDFDAEYELNDSDYPVLRIRTSSFSSGTITQYLHYIYY